MLQLYILQQLCAEAAIFVLQLHLFCKYMCCSYMCCRYMWCSSYMWLAALDFWTLRAAQMSALALLCVWQQFPKCLHLHLFHPTTNINFTHVSKVGRKDCCDSCRGNIFSCLRTSKCISHRMSQREAGIEIQYQIQIQIQPQIHINQKQIKYTGSQRGGW